MWQSSIKTKLSIAKNRTTLEADEPSYVPRKKIMGYTGNDFNKLPQIEKDSIDADTAGNSVIEIAEVPENFNGSQQVERLIHQVQH